VFLKLWKQPDHKESKGHLEHLQILAQLDQMEVKDQLEKLERKAFLEQQLQREPLAPLVLVE
jgi:hypothetical protein